MPNWKKVLLSGSKASVFDITASNLPAENGSSNDVIVINSEGHFASASRGSFGGGASGPLKAIQFSYSEDGGSNFLLSGSEFLLFDEPNRELLVSASGDGNISIGKDGGSSGISKNDVLGNLNFIGTGSAIIEGPSATVRAVATQNFSANTKGAQLEFLTADDQDAVLGVPKLTISGSVVSSSVDLLGNNLITAGDIYHKEGTAQRNILSIGGTGFAATLGYGGWSRLDIVGGTGGVRFLSPITSSLPISSSNTITANNLTSNDALIANLTISGDKIQDTSTANTTFIGLDGDIEIGSNDDIFIYLDSNNLSDTGLFNIYSGVSSSAQTGATDALVFQVTGDGDVSASGHLHIEGDITSSGTVKAEGLALNLTSQTDNARNLMVYHLGELYSSDITLGKTKYISASSNSGLSRTGTGPYTFSLDLDSLATSTTDGDGDFFAVVDSSGNQKKLTKGNISLAGFDNTSTGFTSNAGTLTGNGTSTYVPYYNGTTSFSNESSFTYNATLNTLSVPNISSSGQILLGSDITHQGDTDTKIAFYNDEIQLRAGETAGNDNYLILKASEKRNLMKGGLQIEGDSGTTWGIHLSASTNVDISSADDTTGGDAYIDILNDRSGNANPIGGIRWKNTNSGESGTVSGILSYNENYSVATNNGDVTTAAGDSDGTLEFHTADNGTNKKALVLTHNGQSHFPQTANFGSSVYIHGTLYMPSLASNAGPYQVRYSTSTDDITYSTSRRATKKNIVAIGDKNSTLTTDIFSSIKPRTFVYKNSPNYLTAGFIAEELAEVSPVLTNWGPNSFVDKEGNVENKNLINDDIVPVDIDDRAMLALCVAKIQELEAEIKELKTKVS